MKYLLTILLFFAFVFAGAQTHVSGRWQFDYISAMKGLQPAFDTFGSPIMQPKDTNTISFKNGFPYVYRPHGLLYRWDSLSASAIKFYDSVLMASSFALRDTAASIRSIIPGANNGLSNVSGKIGLDGPLIRNTAISIDTKTLHLYSITGGYNSLLMDDSSTYYVNKRGTDSLNFRIVGSSINAGYWQMAANRPSQGRLTNLWLYPNGVVAMEAKDPFGDNFFYLTGSSAQINSLGGANGSLVTSSLNGVLGRVGPGTNGYVLTMVAGNPAWAPGGGGGFSSWTAGYGFTPAGPVTNGQTASLDTFIATSIYSRQKLIDSITVNTTIAGIRAYTSAKLGLLYVTDAGKEGFFQYDPADVSSSDNLGLILVDLAGNRYKRIYSGDPWVTWFGAIGDGVTDNAAAFVLATNACQGLTLYFPPGLYKVLSAPNINLNNTRWRGEDSTSVVLGTLDSVINLTGANYGGIYNMKIRTEKVSSAESGVGVINARGIDMTYFDFDNLEINAPLANTDAISWIGTRGDSTGTRPVMKYVNFNKLRLKNVGRIGIDIFNRRFTAAAYADVTGINITNCVSDSLGTKGSYGLFCSLDGTGSFANIDNNILINCLGEGIEVQSYDYSTISNNKFYYTTRSFIPVAVLGITNPAIGIKLLHNTSVGLNTYWNLFNVQRLESVANEIYGSMNTVNNDGMLYLIGSDNTFTGDHITSTASGGIRIQSPTSGTYNGKKSQRNVFRNVTVTALSGNSLRALISFEGDSTYGNVITESQLLKSTDSGYYRQVSGAANNTVCNNYQDGVLSSACSNVPAQFNPIAGTNITLSGTYPNITFNSIASGGGATPGGNPTQIQWKNAVGNFGATSTFTFDSTNRMMTIDRQNGDSAAIVIKQTNAGVGARTVMKIYPPVNNDSTQTFEIASSLAANLDGTRSNHILKIGHNLFDQYTGKPASWDAWESNWFSGGARYMERHYEVAMNNGADEHSRLFSNTFIARDSLGNSSSIWDFRGSFNLHQPSVNDGTYFSVAPGDTGSTSLHLFGLNGNFRTDFGFDNSDPHTLSLTTAKAAGGNPRRMTMDVGEILFNANGAGLTYDGANTLSNVGLAQNPQIVRTGAWPVQLGFANTYGGANSGEINVNAGTGEMQISSGPFGGGYFMTFYTDGGERVRIDRFGRTMIATTTPEGSLTVGGTVAIDNLPHGATTDSLVTYDATGHILNKVQPSFMMYQIVDSTIFATVARLGKLKDSLGGIIPTLNISAGNGMTFTTITNSSATAILKTDTSNASGAIITRAKAYNLMDSLGAIMNSMVLTVTTTGPLIQDFNSGNINLSIDTASPVIGLATKGWTIDTVTSMINTATNNHGGSPTTNTLGVNVTSVTVNPGGSDRAFSVTVVTSGNVNGTICNIAFYQAYSVTPIVSSPGFGADNVTRAATTNTWAGATSGSAISFGGQITGAGTYVYNFIVQQP